MIDELEVSGWGKVGKGILFGVQRLETGQERTLILGALHKGMRGGTVSLDTSHHHGSIVIGILGGLEHNLSAVLFGHVERHAAILDGKCHILHTITVQGDFAIYESFSGVVRGNEIKNDLQV